MESRFLRLRNMRSHINDLGKARAKHNSVFGITSRFLWPIKPTVIFVIIIPNERDDTTFKRLIDDVLKFIVKLDLSVSCPAIKILVTAAHINSVKNVDPKS